MTRLAWNVLVIIGLAAAYWLVLGILGVELFS